MNEQSSRSHLILSIVIEVFWVEFVGVGIEVDRFQQCVVYGDIPTFCISCKHIGHLYNVCKVLGAVEEEMVAQTQNSANPTACNIVEGTFLGQHISVDNAHMEDIFSGNDTQVNKLQNGGGVEVQASEVGSELVIEDGVEFHLERLQFGSKYHVSTAHMVEKNVVEMGVLKQISANVATAETLSQFPRNKKQVAEKVLSVLGSPQVSLDAGHKDLSDSTREASFMDHEKASMNTYDVSCCYRELGHT